MSPCMCGDTECPSCGVAMGTYGMEGVDLETPEQIKEHSTKYYADAWMEYTPEELGQWVCLLMKRSGMRTQMEKANKDALDARNYLRMLEAHLNKVFDDNARKFEQPRP